MNRLILYFLYHNSPALMLTIEYNQSAKCCYHRKMIILRCRPLTRDEKQTSLGKTIIIDKIRVVFFKLDLFIENKLENAFQRVANHNNELRHHVICKFRLLSNVNINAPIIKDKYQCNFIRGFLNQYGFYFP